ncbi:MAG: hypothetical protein JWM44_2387 [Bacilli bacterium]|nr:hypothetical protein [Bacilli bacterium]
MEKNLNASEMGNLWTTYISNSTSICLIRFYLQHVEDGDIKMLLDHALHNSEKSLTDTKRFFEEINFPNPIGFSDSDVNLKAPRLFSDKFMLFNMLRLSEYAMIILGSALSTSKDRGVRDFYSELLALNITLFNEACDLSFKKGIHVSPPSIPIPENVKLFNKETILETVLGERRTMSAIEIREIVFNLTGMIHGEAILTGFSQSAQSKEIREFLLRGKEICTKQINVLQMLLKEDDLPSMPTLETEVTESKESPFSDRLMMTLTVFLIQLAFARYGIAISQCARNDITANLARLTAEIATFLKDGSDIMIEKKWLEQPPTAINREAAVKH